MVKDKTQGAVVKRETQSHSAKAERLAGRSFRNGAADTEGIPIVGSNPTCPTNFPKPICMECGGQKEKKGTRMIRKLDTEPYQRFGFCVGCGNDRQLTLVGTSRYRCAECSNDPTRHWVTNPKQITDECPDCGGSGNDADDMAELERWNYTPHIMACSHCNGTGKIETMVTFKHKGES